MNEIIGVGIIGAGGRGRGIAKKITQNDERIKVLAVADPLAEALEASKEDLGDDIDLYEDYQEMLQDPRISWVLVGSWNCMHGEHVVASFEAGKHVFCEKPLATTLDDCIAIRNAWKASGKYFIIGFTLRYSSHYNKIKQLIQEGEIGDILSFEFNETVGWNFGGHIMGDWRRLREYAGTHLLEKCCHDIDIANWITGSYAKRVSSFGGLNFFLPENAHYIDKLGKNENGKDAYRTWHGSVNKNPFTSNKDIVDNQVAIIEYANDVRATFHTNCNAAITERRMYICGTEGGIRSDVTKGQIELQRIGFNEERQDVSTEAKGGHGGGGVSLAANIQECMIGKSQPWTGLEDGLKSAITCYGIDQALDRGSVVDMRPFWEKAGIQMDSDA